MIIHGDCRTVLAFLEAETVQCCVTSPPYWGLRDYGYHGQIGLEDSVSDYVQKIVQVFRQVARVLKRDGTLWLNIGDTYVSSGGAGNQGLNGERIRRTKPQRNLMGNSARKAGLPPKSLVGIPWKVAFALQADGWLLRQDIIWHKPNPLPESVQDRCTRAHEYMFLLTRSRRYLWNRAAMTEPVSGTAHPRVSKKVMAEIRMARSLGANTVASNPRDPSEGAKYQELVPGVASSTSLRKALSLPVSVRNRRSVWTVQSRPFKGAHAAVFPPQLIEPCILAGSNPGDLVLDPFGGAGTTGLVAARHGRRYLMIEASEQYCELMRQRLTQEALPI